jgi:hypothetical protein
VEAKRIYREQGTNLNSQKSFAVLGNEEIMHLVEDMGVNISPE